MDESMIKKRLDYFKEKKVEVHIVKKDKEWLNCFVISEEEPGVYIVKERKFGTMHVFLEEVQRVNEIFSR